MSHRGGGKLPKHREFVINSTIQTNILSKRAQWLNWISCQQRLVVIIVTWRGLFDMRWVSSASGLHTPMCEWTARLSFHCPSAHPLAVWTNRLCRITVSTGRLEAPFCSQSLTQFLIHIKHPWNWVFRSSFRCHWDLLMCFVVFLQRVIAVWQNVLLVCSWLCLSLLVLLLVVFLH